MNFLSTYVCVWVCVCVCVWVEENKTFQKKKERKSWIKKNEEKEKGVKEKKNFC